MDREPSWKIQGPAGLSGCKLCDSGEMGGGDIIKGNARLLLPESPFLILKAFSSQNRLLRNLPQTIPQNIRFQSLRLLPKILPGPEKGPHRRPFSGPPAFSLLPWPARPDNPRPEPAFPLFRPDAHRLSDLIPSLRSGRIFNRIRFRA